MRRLIVTMFAAGAALAGAPAGAASPTAAELLRYLPAGAEVVVAMNFAALREHPMVQAWLVEHQAAWSGAHSDEQEFLREAGLDPLHDIDSMVAAMVPGPGRDRGLAAFGGRFDPASLTAALIKRGSVPVAIGGVNAIRLQDPQHADPEAPVLYLTGDVALAGDEATLRAVLSAPAPASALVAREVAAGRLDLESPFWMVAIVPAPLRERVAARAEDGGDGSAEAFRAVMTATRTVQRVTVQAALGDDLAVTGSAAADSEENAGLIRDAVKGAIAAARLHLQGQSPELVDVLRDIEISVEGSEVRGSATIPVPVIEKLVAQRHQQCAEHVAPARSN